MSLYSRGRSSIVRRLAGLLFLSVVIVAWTTSNFLNSSILSNNEYSHPFFVIYISTSFFTVPLLPLVLWRVWRASFVRDDEKSSDRNHGDSPFSGSASRYSYSTFEEHSIHEYQHAPAAEASEAQQLLDYSSASGQETSCQEHHNSSHHDEAGEAARITPLPLPPLTVRETFKLSLKFCLLWLSANYLNTACLQYTTVASTTILASSSSVWTLIIGAVAGVEHFTSRKLFGVFVLVMGVAMIALMDVNSSPSDRGNFPDKTPGELILGDAMSLASAVIYGFYITAIAKTVGNSSRINMPLFFGFIGAVNILCAWPFFFILHVFDIEKFALPPNRHVWTIIIANALVSLVSDLCWAIAVLLTSPLIVTVGLSLTIPLSLVGQEILYRQHAGPLYWAGACLVVLAFVTVEQDNGSSTEQQQQSSHQTMDLGDA